MHSNSSAEQPVLLTLAEVARRLRVSRATVYAWAADGTLPVIRLGPRPLLRVHPEVLEAWLQAPKCPIDSGDVTESSEAYELSNVVETALAKALVLAAEARRWDIVVRIADELRRRRERLADQLLLRGRFC